MMRFKVGDVYNGFKIIEKVGENRYKCQCLKCMQVTEKFSNNINRRGCGVCSNKIVISGVNDCLTTNSELLQFVVKREEYEKLSFGSATKVKAKCPDCGNVKSISLCSLINNGIGCNKCGDGMSFPNKFMYSMLIQSSVEFECEKKFEWSQNRLYDFYLPKANIIIEVNGKQHYNKNGFRTLSGKTLEEEQENDRIKKHLAHSNNIKVVEIDCYKSEINYIRESIIKTGLLQMLSISEQDIDWLSCLEHASSNLVKEICNLFNLDSDLTSQKIANMFHLSKQTIISYLKRGSILGWCNYEPKEQMRKIGAQNGHGKSKMIICYEHSEKVFTNAKQCSIYLNERFGYKTDENNIRNTCRYKQEHHCKLHFFYVENLYDCDIECIGITEGEGKYTGTLGSIVCDYKGNRVGVGGFTDEEREFYWNHPEEIIGRIVTVKYKEVTKNKDTGLESLQFPVFIAVNPIGKEVSYN